MDFNNKVYTIVKIFGIDIWITETLVNTWIIILFLSIFAVTVNILLKKFSMLLVQYTPSSMKIAERLFLLCYLRVVPCSIHIF